MEKYVITTENTADLPYSYYKEHQVGYMYLTYQLDGITYNKENELDFKEFYSRMRAGSMPTTSQVNSEEAKDVLRPLLEAGKCTSGSRRTERRISGQKDSGSRFAVCFSWRRPVRLQSGTDERSGGICG